SNRSSGQRGIIVSGKFQPDGARPHRLPPQNGVASKTRVPSRLVERALVSGKFQPSGAGHSRGPPTRTWRRGKPRSPSRLVEASLTPSHTTSHDGNDHRYDRE